MESFRWESFIFWNSKKFSSHCVEIFEQISKKSKNPPETFRFWSGDLHIMVSEKNAEFRGRAQFITIECPQRRCDLAPKTLIFKTKSKVFFWIPYSSMNDRTAPRVWPPFGSRKSPSHLYCNTLVVNSSKWGGGRHITPCLVKIWPMRKHPWPIPGLIFISYQAEQPPVFKQNIWWGVSRKTPHQMFCLNTGGCSAW